MADSSDIELSSTCNYVDMSLTGENHANVDKKYFTTYIDMLFQSNGTLKYLRNKLVSNFSKDTTIIVFYRPSFILLSQSAQHFQVVVYPGPFLCYEY